MPFLHWQSGDIAHSIVWQSQSGWSPSKKVVEIDDTISADTAYRLASEGQGLIWRGDFQNAKQLLQAIKRRLTQRKAIDANLPLPERFHRIRLARSQAARTLGQLIILVEPGYQLKLRRAPAIAEACEAAYGLANHLSAEVDAQVTNEVTADLNIDLTHERVNDAGFDLSKQPFALPLTELIGVLSAHQWQKQGVAIESLNAHIYPQHGVFAPTRQEYLTLIQQAPLPQPCRKAFDIGTGTGVIAALLISLGVEHVVATELSPRALRCAAFNIQQLGLTDQIRFAQVNLFPPGQADLIVCNPPWLPGKVHSPLDAAIYDPDSTMLKGFIDGVGQHLTVGGQAWLVLSDIAEHLNLRSRETLLGWFKKAGLSVIEKHDLRPSHPKIQDSADPLHAQRALEVTSLWRLSAETP
jgi:methylase of polypeptide subunit release factors